MDPKTGTAKFDFHRAQGQFINSQAMLRGFVGGRGAGKTLVGAVDLIMRAKPGRLYLVASPSYTVQRDTTFRTFIDVARQMGRFVHKVESPFPRVWFRPFHCAKSAEVIFRSADDPEALRGPNLSGAWLDEASLLDRQTYLLVIPALREAGEVGWLSATFTPKGKRNWTYDVFGTGRPGTAIFHASTRDNLFLHEQLAGVLQTEYGATRLAAQELGGEFIDVEGAEWPMDYFGPHIWFDEWPNAQSIAVRAIALDPSKGKDAKHGDYSAFVWGAETRDGTLWVDADLERRPVAKIVEDGFRIVAAFPVDGFAVETNQFQELLATEFVRVSRERGLVLPMFKINNYINKKVRIRRCGHRLAQKRIRFKANSPGARLLVDQLMAFGEDSKEHDDGPDALDQLSSTINAIKTGRRQRELESRFHGGGVELVTV